MAVDNQAQEGGNYDTSDPPEYESIYGDGSVVGNRGYFFDGVGQVGGLRMDGVMPQAIADGGLNDEADLYFDPNTFMTNFITYIPGDYDFSGQVQIYDLTPLGRFDEGNFNKSSNFYNPTVLPCASFADESRVFVPGSNHYFLRWIDGDFNSGVDGLTGSVNDLTPILGYSDNRPSHYGQQAKTYYIVVTDNSSLAGHMYTMDEDDRVLIFQRSGVGVVSSSNVRMVAEYPGDIDGDDAYFTAASDSGFFTYDNAPYYSTNEPDPRGWPTEYSAYIEPDLLEVWNVEDPDGVWDKPSSSYYMYYGTYDDSSGSPSYGVLTPVGTFSGTTWTLSDMSAWSDALPPKLLPLTNGERSIALSLLRKEFTFTQQATSSITAARKDYYSEILTNYDWRPFPDNTNCVANYNYVYSRFEIDVTYPEAWDISGVSYEFFLTTSATHVAPREANSFFINPGKMTRKQGVDYYTESTYGDGKFKFTSYNGSPLALNETYKVMVRPKDGAGNIPADRSVDGWDELEMTATAYTQYDTTPPDFDGLTSATPTRTPGEIVVTYPKAYEVGSTPIEYNVGYALTSSYPDVDGFIEDWENLPTNPNASEGKILTDTLEDVNDSVHGSWPITGLTGDAEYYFMMRVTDGVGLEDDNEVVIIATPISNAPPAWGTYGTAITNVKENGSGSVLVYFGDADDEDGVSYRAIYGKRDDLVTQEAFWVAYNDPNNTDIHRTNWTPENQLTRDTGNPDPLPDEEGYYYILTINGLDNEDAYWFAIRAKDNDATNPKEEDNTKIVPCRPSIYTWTPMDNTDNYNGYYPDVAAFNYTDGFGSHTRLGISYLAAEEVQSDLAVYSHHNCEEVRYVSFDTGTTSSIVNEEVSDYDESKVSLAETSITFLNDRTAPAIAYFANDTSQIQDLRVDNAGLNPTEEEHRQGSKVTSENGVYCAVQYAEYRDSDWWLDNVDRTPAWSMYFLGIHNGITNCYWQHPDGNWRWSPVVAYTDGLLCGDRGLGTKCRLLVREDLQQEAWTWRPYRWGLYGDQFKYSENAITIDFGSVITTLPIGVDLIRVVDDEEEIFYYGYAGQNLGCTDTYSGIVGKAVDAVVDTSTGWAFNLQDIIDPWDTVDSSRGDWYIENRSQTSASLIGKLVCGYKFASYQVGSTYGYGSVIYADDGIYYLDSGSTSYSVVESFSAEQENELYQLKTMETLIGLAFNSQGQPGIVYPIWDDDEDTWVLRVAEGSGSPLSWSIQTVLYSDESDMYLRQGHSFRCSKIAYLHTITGDRWAVVYSDINYRGFTDEEQTTPFNKLMMIIEP